MRQTVLIVAFVLAVALAPVLADAELVLQDGRVLRGVEVRLVGDVYVIESASGDSISVPLELVVELRLEGGEPDEPAQPGIRAAVPGRLGGAARDPRAPSGLRNDEPRTLVGTEARLPRADEQLRVFGDSAGFPKSVIEHEWQPWSDWKLNLENNDFAPSRWASSTFDPVWTPRSSFDADVNVFGTQGSRWSEGVVDPFWRPRDGFGLRAEFWQD